MLLGRRGPDEALVPARPARSRAARLVRRALLDGRGGLDLLPRPADGDGAGLGRPDAARLRHAREGVRPDDAPSGPARAAPARAPRGDAGRRAGPGRPAAARAARARLPRVPRCPRAAPAGGQARRDPLPAPAVRRPEAGSVRLPRVGARPARRRRDAGRVPPPRLVRGGPANGAAALARGAPHVVRHGRRAEGRRRERPADARRRHGPDRLRALPRPQRGHLERPRRRRRPAVRLPLRRGRARANGSSRCASSPAQPSRPTRSSTTTTRPTASPRRPPGPSSCAGCSRSRTYPSPSQSGAPIVQHRRGSAVRLPLAS